MKRLLITGGSGFVGGHLVSRAHDRFHIAATYHDHPLQSPDSQTAAMSLDDERSLQHAVELLQPDVIIHTAAWVHPDACEENPALAHHRNASATEVLAEAASRQGARFIYCSSDMVFDGVKGCYSETDRPNPINAYGRSKLLGERFAASVCKNTVIARLALVYGPGLHQRANSFSEQIRGRIRRGEEQPLFTDEYRTPVLVTDLADALLELAQSPFTGVIHLGGSRRVDRLTFGRTLARLHGLSQERFRPRSVDEVKMKAPRPVDVSLDTSLAQRVLKTPLRGIEEGLKEA